MLPPFSIKLTSISNSTLVYGDSVPAITSKVEDGFEYAYQKLFENGKQKLDKDKEIVYNKATLGEYYE